MNIAQTGFSVIVISTGGLNAYTRYTTDTRGICESDKVMTPLFASKSLCGLTHNSMTFCPSALCINAGAPFRGSYMLA